MNEKNVFTLPSEAIIDFNNQSYIFIKEDNDFIRFEITKGIEQNDYCEIVDVSKQIVKGDIVIKGAYY